MRIAHTFWTDEEVAYLRQNWLKATATEIAKALGKSFTRNAVIGKAHRLGLPKKPTGYMGKQ